jgi:hypothetical protein
MEVGKQQLVEISIYLILSVRWMYHNSSSNQSNSQELSFQQQGLKL